MDTDTGNNMKALAWAASINIVLASTLTCFFLSHTVFEKVLLTILIGLKGS